MSKGNEKHENGEHLIENDDKTTACFETQIMASH